MAPINLHSIWFNLVEIMSILTSAPASWSTNFGLGRPCMNSHVSQFLIVWIVMNSNFARLRMSIPLHASPLPDNQICISHFWQIVSEDPIHCPNLFPFPLVHNSYIDEIGPSDQVMCMNGGSCILMNLFPLCREFVFVWWPVHTPRQFCVNLFNSFLFKF